MPTAEPPFGVIRLRGGRYEQVGLPLVGAAELARYEKLVHNVARSLYLAKNPNRSRVPRGTRFEFALRLTAVESGSVMPVLERPVADDALFNGPDWFEQSRVLINEALRGFSDSKSHLIAAFPADCLDDFTAFGRSLADDESIEFSDVDGTDPPAILNAAVRRKIVQHTKLAHLDVEVALIGRLVGLRSGPQHFDFVLDDGGRRFTGSSYKDGAMFGQLKSVLGEGDRAPLVSLAAVVKQSPTGEIEAIQDALGVELTLPETWRDRLTALSELPADWLDDQSTAPTADALDQAERLLLNCLDELLPRPGIFPMPDGGVQLEWTDAGSETEVQITPIGAVHALWFSTVDDSEREQNFGPDDNMVTVAAFIREGVA